MLESKTSNYKSKTTANGNFLVCQFSFDEGALCPDWHPFFFFFSPQSDWLVQGQAVWGCIRHDNRVIKTSDCKKYELRAHPGWAPHTISPCTQLQRCVQASELSSHGWLDMLPVLPVPSVLLDADTGMPWL